MKQEVRVIKRKIDKDVNILLVVLIIMLTIVFILEANKTEINGFFNRDIVFHSGIDNR